MITAMRELALDYLMQKETKGQYPLDSEKWYQNFRQNTPEKLFFYLVEDVGKIETAYILSKKDVLADTATLSVQDIQRDSDSKGCTPEKLPFIKPTGAQSPAIGPVLKRSYDKNKGGGPTAKILKSTMKYFQEVADSNKPWSEYFQDVLSVLHCSNLVLPDGGIINWLDAGYSSLLACVVDRIDSQKNTVFVTVRNSAGKLPGEVPAYLKYLLKEKLAGERYVTKKVPAQEQAECPLCNAKNITVYPNALRGAGISFINMDREGVFSQIKLNNAWKAFALCGSCADLLYIYKNQVLKKGGPKKDKRPFSAYIAGSVALIIPHFLPGLAVAERVGVLVEEVDSYINEINTDVEDSEADLLDVLKDKKSILNLDILWVEVGQNIENVIGIITAVLPSRLKELSKINEDAVNWQHGLFPKIEVEREPNNLKPNLSLIALNSLFKRPGGDKAKEINKNKQLFELKRQIADAVYHQKILFEERFWSEILITARWYLAEVIEKEKGHLGLLYEGSSKKGGYLTAAGWIKHLNWWAYYFKEVGILKSEKDFFEPSMKKLKSCFGPESGIDSAEKAFAFLLGILYGKLLEVQGAKGVNVGANALTWLKRLTLKGRDLPELYTKIRAKLLAYGTESNAEVRELLAELSRLGIKLGDEIRLDEVKTNYYLLLGQAMSKEVLPSKKEGDKK